MRNKKTFGSRLSYDQWKFLSNGNIKSYMKYVRQYSINLKLFNKKYVAKLAA